MCGRGRCSLAPEHLERRVRIPRNRWRDRERYQPSYNIGPGGWLPVIRTSENAERELQTMKWGLMPGYSKKDAKMESFKMFNARSERLTESGVYRRLIPNKRCVVLLNGFYEWKKHANGKKQPYYVHQGDDNLVMLAGLYDAWEGMEGVVYTTAIITTTSSQNLSWLHSRMPVILPNEEAVDLWLSTGDVPWSDLEKLLEPYNGADIEFYPVTERIGKTSFQGAECAVDVRKRGLDSFLKTTESDEEEEPRKKRMKKEEATKKRMKKDSEEEEKIPTGKKLKVDTKLKKTVKKTREKDPDASTSKRVKFPKQSEAKKVDNKEDSSPTRRSARLRSMSPK